MSDSQTAETPNVHHVTAHAVAERHVLIADSNASSRSRRRTQLTGCGYYVSVARTGFETIVKACCHMPDLVVLDESLGDTEVEETARLLATCPVTAHIPVVKLGTGRLLPQRVLARLQLATI